MVILRLMFCCENGSRQNDDKAKGYPFSCCSAKIPDEGELSPFTEQCAD